MVASVLAPWEVLAMSNLTAQPPPQLSLDGRWRWDGTRWVPVKLSKRPDRLGPGAPQLSPDGQWWWTGYQWVPAKAASIPPSPPQGASTGPSAAGPGPKPRRRRWWIIVGIFIASVVGVGIAGVVVDEATHASDPYTADLTRGSGKFVTTDEVGRTLFYDADGYHVVNKGAAITMTGVKAYDPPTVVAAEVTARAVTAPPGATAFGPFVESDRTHGPLGAYWLGVDSAGTVTLNEIFGANEVIASGKGPPLSPGTTHTLMLTCAITDGTVRLAGYVDGKRVISGTPTIKIPHVAVTGMVGYTPLNSSAEWVATRFARLGPDDMPANTPGLP